MSKKKARSPILQHTNGRREQEYVTSLGVAVMVGPLPPMLPDLVRAAVEAEWEEAGKMLPKKPTYIVTNVAGDTETHEHDATTLTTDDDRAAWAKWESGTAALNAEVTNRTFEELVRQCVTFDVKSEWAQKYKRLRPPEDEDERRWFYARAAVIGSGDDIRQIMVISSRLTGVDQRLIDAVEDSFPGGVGDKAEADSAEATEAEGG